MKFWLHSVALVWSLLALGFTQAQTAVPDRASHRAHLRMGLVNPRCFCSATSDEEYNRSSINANLQRHCYFIDRLAGQGVEFVGFPEMSVTGYQFSPWMTWLRLDGPEVRKLRDKARERGVYVAAGFAEQEADGKRWNTHIVIDPQGEIIARHHKIELTDEEGYTGSGTELKVFTVKGVKMGIAICADGSKRRNLQTLAARGARIIYAPHATRNNGTTAGWYRFRSDWSGPDGWIAQLGVYAALHNHAGQYHPDFKPPWKVASAGWCSGAWFIGPKGETLARMPRSTSKADSLEHVLIHDIPLNGK
ncbi:MAG: carbon-nitrogen hydrolase family protein [Planctomycetia bacterium]|nr:carbon-nitrogen hydrolase family protein [Planctomycetia bacterium]